MFDKIQHIQKEIDSFKASSFEEVEQLRINLLGKKGKITLRYW